MTLTTQQIYDLNNSDAAMQNGAVGTLLANLESGASGPYKSFTQTILYSQFTDGGGASGTFTITAGTIPAGATYQVTQCTALTGFTGDTSATIQIGDGTTVARYSTGTPSVFTTAANGISVGAASGTTFHSAAKSIVVTITSGSDWGLVTAGSITLKFNYLS